MSWTSDRKLMYPTDVDTLFKLLWAVYDASDALEEFDSDTWRADTDAFTIARDNLLDFILEHRLDLFDLLFRGRCSNLWLEYVDIERDENDYIKPTHAYRYVYDKEEQRPLLPRELYHAPYTEFGVPSKPALTKLIAEANESCTGRGHDMDWRLVTDDIADGECTKCGKGVTCRTKPAPNSINIGGEAVALGCEDENKNVS